MVALSSTQRSRIREIARSHGASNLRVFGSRANGTASKGSDLDLLVRFEPEATLLNVIGFQQAIEEALGLKVDVVEEGGLSPFLKKRILGEAVAL